MFSEEALGGKIAWSFVKQKDFTESAAGRCRWSI